METHTSRAPGQGTMCVLTREECLALLGETGVGRVAFIGPSGPLIHPVNYLMEHDTIVIRTSPYTRLGERAAGPVAFEVDDLDPELRRGWSVLVVGNSLPVDDADEAIALRRNGRVASWAGGHRNMFVRITPREITGRRIT